MLAVLGLVCIILVATASAKRYHAHDHVGIVANTVGPFNNPTETYPVRFEIPSLGGLRFNCFCFLLSLVLLFAFLQRNGKAKAP
jgi:hypothetical protein